MKTVYMMTISMKKANARRTTSHLNKAFTVNEEDDNSVPGQSLNYRDSTSHCTIIKLILLILSPSEK